MAINRKATAVWNGSGKEGTGNLTTQSGVLAKAQYSYTTRFEEGIGTNPEELIAAAHAGCFCMKLSFVLGGAGFTPDSLETACTISLDNGEITQSKLVLTAKVPEITSEIFRECVTEAVNNCPISKLLNTKFEVEYTIN